MKLKIIYDVKSKITGKIKKMQVTFSNFAEDVTDEGLKQFVNAYSSLVEKESYEAYKVIEEQIL